LVGALVIKKINVHGAHSLNKQNYVKAIQITTNKLMFLSMRTSYCIKEIKNCHYPYFYLFI